MAISLSQKIAKNQKARLHVFEILLLEEIFVTLTENSPVIINETRKLVNIHTTGNSFKGTCVTWN